MKIKNLEIIVVVLVLINIFTLFKINSVENSIERRMLLNENDLNNLESNINNIYSNVDAMVKKQASILDSYDIRIGDKLNSDDYTVPVTLSVTPKEYSDGLTATFQANDNKNIEMKKDGTSFLGTTDVYIFDDFQLKIILEQDGVQKTESLEKYPKLQYKYLLDISGGFSGNTSYNSLKYNYKGEVNLHFANSQNNKPKKVKIGQYINGTNKTIVNEQEVDSSGYVAISVDNSVELNKNDEFILYALVQDSYGINYKYALMQCKIDSDGKQENRRPEWSSGSVIEISDKNGAVLYMPEYMIKE